MDFMDRKRSRGILEIGPDEIVPAIHGVRFPAERGELLETARRNGAAGEIVAALGRLPERRYGAVTDVEDEFGRIRRDARGD